MTSSLPDIENDLTEPLLPNENERYLETTNNDNVQAVKEHPNRLLVVIIFAGTCTFLWILSITLYTSTFPIIAMVLGTFVSVLAGYQEFRIVKQRNIRDAIAALKQEADELKIKVDELSSNAEQLEEEAKRSREVESKLDSLVSSSGITVDDFTELVKENKKIQEDIEQNLKHTAMEDLFSVIINVDWDADYKVEGDEVLIVSYKLQHIDGLQDLDQTTFMKEIEKRGNSVPSIFSICEEWLNKPRRIEAVNNKEGYEASSTTADDYLTANEDSSDALPISRDDDKKPRPQDAPVREAEATELQESKSITTADEYLTANEDSSDALPISMDDDKKPTPQDAPVREAEATVLQESKSIGTSIIGVDGPMYPGVERILKEMHGPMYPEVMEILREVNGPMYSEVMEILQQSD